MTKNYSQEELDQILLSKKLNEFYLAVIENRGELLTDEEYAEIMKHEMVLDGENKEDVKDLFNQIKTDDNLKDYASELMKVMFSVGTVRHLAVLTPINDEFYDIANGKFVDLKRNKIVHFDNLTCLYNDNNARIKYFTPQEEPQIPYNMVLLDVDDESIIRSYEDKYIKQEESEDLTSLFIEEIKGKPYTLKKS